MTEQKRGFLLVIEGLDGSGKTTLVQALKDALTQQAVKVHTRAYPTTVGAVGKFIRETLQGFHKVAVSALTHLFIADGLDSEDSLQALLDSGHLVICDRHPLVSTWVYQTEDRHIHTILPFLGTEEFIRPDLVVIVDTPIEDCLARIQQRTKKIDLTEQDDIEYLHRLRSKYLAYLFLYADLAVSLDGRKPLAQQVERLIGILTVGMQQSEG